MPKCANAATRPSVVCLISPNVGASVDLANACNEEATSSAVKPVCANVVETLANSLASEPSSLERLLIVSLRLESCMID